nr:hypothetical protein [Tanacetum cinerariifolium]
MIWLHDFQLFFIIGYAYRFKYMYQDRYLAYALSMPPLLSLPLSMACDDGCSYCSFDVGLHEAMMSLEVGKIKDEVVYTLARRLTKVAAMADVLHFATLLSLIYLLPIRLICVVGSHCIEVLVIVRVLALRIIGFATMTYVSAFFDSYNDADIDYEAVMNLKRFVPRLGESIKVVIVRCFAWQIIRFAAVANVSGVFDSQPIYAL